MYRPVMASATSKRVCCFFIPYDLFFLNLASNQSLYHAKSSQAAISSDLAPKTLPV